MGHLVYPIILPENIRSGVFASNRFSRWSRNLWSSLTWADCSRKPLNPKHGLQIIRLLQGLCNTEPGNLVPWDTCHDSIKGSLHLAVADQPMEHVWLTRSHHQCLVFLAVLFPVSFDFIAVCFPGFLLLANQYVSMLYVISGLSGTRNSCCKSDSRNCSH